MTDALCTSASHRIIAFTKPPKSIWAKIKYYFSVEYSVDKKKTAAIKRMNERFNNQINYWADYCVDQALHKWAINQKSEIEYTKDFELSDFNGQNFNIIADAFKKRLAQSGFSANIICEDIKSSSERFKIIFNFKF